MSNHKLSGQCAGCGQEAPLRSLKELTDFTRPSRNMLGGIPGAVGAVDTPLVHPNRRCEMMAKQRLAGGG